MVRCFLFGAGASKACDENMPLMSDFIKKINKYKLPKLELELSKLNLNITENTNLEDLLTKIKASNNQTTTQKKILNILDEHIYELIVLQNWKFLDNNKYNLIDLLLESENLNKEKEGDFFISLNYDLILDRAIWRQKLESQKITDIKNYCYIDYALPHSVCGKLVFNYDNSYSLIQEPDHRLTIYKIHGSINWQATNLSTDAKIIVLPSILPSALLKQSLLIRPSYEKDLEKYSELRQLMQSLNERLKTVTELIIIGTSLSEKDESINKIFNNLNKEVIIKIINNDPNKIQYYVDYFKKLEFKKENISVYSKGFDEKAIDNFIFK